MSDLSIEIEGAIEVVLNLPQLEKVRLVERLMATLERDIAQQTHKSRPSQYGSWADVSVSDSDISEARQSMWGNFPREDI